MRILHYILRSDLSRCHAIFHHDTVHEHLFMSPRIMPTWFPTKNLTKLPIVKLDSDNRIIGIIESLNPDIILFSDYKIDISILKVLYKKYKVWIINHGIWCPGILKRRASKSNKYPHLKYFHKILYTPYEVSYLPSEYADKLDPTNGYIGIDLLRQAQQLHQLQPVNSTSSTSSTKLSKRTILFVTNKAGFTNKVMCDNNKTFQEFEKIMKVLTSFAQMNDYQVHCKMKTTRNLEQLAKKSKWPRNPRVKLIPGSDLIYPHLVQADIVIIQGYSTTFIESLYLNKPTIVCQMPKNVDFLGLNSYPQLSLANDPSQLFHYLKKIHENPTATTTAKLSDREKYLHKYLGSSIPTSLSQKIIQSANNLKS